VSCFKPFKTTLRKERDNDKVRNNYNKPNKATFANWEDKALDLALSKKTSRMGFKLQESSL
jgi:hypothetical protein